MNIDIYASPLGDIIIKAEHDRIVSVSLSCGGNTENCQSSNALTALAKDQLEQYFKGKLKSFTLPIELVGTPFQKKVWNRLLSVPFGETMTYGSVARAIAHDRACRAVGTAVGANPLFIIVPCHRIIAANGKLGGFAYGTDIKKELLMLERNNYSGVLK